MANSGITSSKYEICDIFGWYIIHKDGIEYLRFPKLHTPKEEVEQICKALNKRKQYVLIDRGNAWQVFDTKQRGVGKIISKQTFNKKQMEQLVRDMNNGL